MFKITFSIAILLSLYFSQFALSEDKTEPQKPKAILSDEQKAQQVLNQKTLLLNDKQLEEIISKLSTKEKDSILKIQKEISEWPKSIFDEISNYREFVITARKIAAEKYNKLSPEARQALERETNLKSQLSPETVKFLETVQLRSVNQTN